MVVLMLATLPELLVADVAADLADEVGALAGVAVTRVSPTDAVKAAAAGIALGRPHVVVVVVERDGPLDAVIADLSRTVAARILVVTTRPGDGALPSHGVFDVLPLP